MISISSSISQSPSNNVQKATGFIAFNIPIGSSIFKGQYLRCGQSVLKPNVTLAASSSFRFATVLRDKQLSF